MLSCYFGMQRSATLSSAVWEKMHRASSSQIAVLHPLHQKSILDLGCSSHVRVAFGWVQGQCWLESSRGHGKEGAEEEVLAARLRKESAVCDCCEAQSQNSAPQRGHQDKGQEGKAAFPNSSQNPRNASAMLLGAACLLTQGEHFKHFFISWLCSQAIFLLSSLCCSSLSSSPGTGHLPLVDVFPRSLMHQPFSV